jgi:hypothetical protein
MLPRTSLRPTAAISNHISQLKKKEWPELAPA